MDSPILVDMYDEREDDARRAIRAMLGQLVVEGRCFSSKAEEMNFVGEYVDLLKVRFEDAFDIASDIPDGVLQLYVVPCSVQLLVENAIKHNVASSENPLLVRIAPEGKYLTVSNPLRPKVGPAGAGGLGLRYIQQQYHDAAGKDIVVSSEKGEFIVKLPLIYGGLDNRR